MLFDQSLLVLVLILSYQRSFHVSEA